MENGILTEQEINQKLNDIDDYKVQQRIVESTVRRWEPTGLLKGLAGSKKRNMAVLLENQVVELKRKNLLTETSRTGTATGFEGWSNVALPLVRKVFANLLANEIVSIQPMNLPSGLVFFLDFTFGTTGTNEKDGRVAGTSIYGNTSSSGQPTGGYYGGVMYSYTRNFLSGNLGPWASGATGTSPTTANSMGTASWADCDYDSFISGLLSANPNGFKKFMVPVSSMSNVDETLARAITFSGTQINTYYRRFTKYEPALSAVSFVVSASDFTADYAVTGSWLRKTTEAFRGDFEVGQTGVGNTNATIPQLNIRVTSQPVVAQTRKLKTEWTPELQQDLSAYHDIDAEAELTAMLADQVALEVDREIIDTLLMNGQNTNQFFWDRNMGTFVNPESGATVAGGTFYGTQQDWYQTLVETILEASNRIHKKTLRGSANFMVTSPEVCTMIEATNSFRPVLTMDEKEVKYSLGIEKVGTLSSRWTIYKDPYFQTNKILIGYKGASFLENGFIYSPYVPLVLTPTVLEPDNFTPRKGIMTRYATTTTRPEFYGCIVVQGMRLNSMNQ